MASLGRRTSVTVACVVAALAGCGDGPGPRDPVEREGVAPVDSGRVAAVASAGLTAQQLAWLEQVEAEGFDELDPGPVDDPRVRSFGPAPAPLPESPRPIDRSSPEALVRSALEALAAGDVAALARLSVSREERPTLDEDDAFDAERRFLAPAVQPYWERIASAVRAGEVTLRPGHAPDEALLEVRVEGAAGSYLIRLRKRGDGWYLAG